MPAPNAKTVDRAAPTPAAIRVSADTLFLVGLTEKSGPQPGLVAGSDLTFPVFRLSHSLNEWDNEFVAPWTAVSGAPEVTYSTARREVESFFEEGGTNLYFARYFGPNALRASRALAGSSGTAGTLHAVSVGDWGNQLRAQVVAGSVPGTNFTVIISHASFGELERFTDMADSLALQVATQSSKYVRYLPGGDASDPVVAAVGSFTLGDDDRANVTDAEITTALNSFTSLLGPGQVKIAGATTAPRHQLALNHAKNNDRFAILDTPDTSDATALIVFAATVRALANSDRGALFGPHAVIPSAAGTTRKVGWGAIVAGQIARSDRFNGRYKGPGLAVAGDPRGLPAFATGVAATFTQAQYDTLHDAGVNMARFTQEGLMTYGFRTVAVRATRPVGWQAQHQRTLMAIKAEALKIARRYVFAGIDTVEIARFGGELRDMLREFLKARSLYSGLPDGTDGGPEAAFSVNVGGTVNTPTTISAGELHAEIAVRPINHAEQVFIGVAAIATEGSV